MKTIRSKFISFVLFVVFFFFLSSPLLALQKKKSHPFAFFLSAVSPGMGQLYLGNPEKGIAIWSISSLLGMGILSTVGKLQFGTLNGMVPGHIGFQIQSNIDSEHLFWAGSLSVTYIILYFYNLSDVAKYSTVRPRIEVNSNQTSLLLQSYF